MQTFKGLHVKKEPYWLLRDKSDSHLRQLSLPKFRVKEHVFLGTFDKKSIDFVVSEI